MKLAAPLAACLLLSACSSLEKRLLSDKPQVRAEAGEAAAAAKPQIRRRIAGAMSDILADADDRRRAYAAAALEDIGPEAAAAQLELITALEDKDPDVAASATRTLEKLPGAAPVLAAAMAGAGPGLRVRLGLVLSAHGEAGASALAKNFERGNKDLAAASAEALGRMGPAAATAVPALARAAASSEPGVRTAAAAALGDIGAPAGLWLAEALASPNPKSRAGAAKVLAAIPEPPAEALGALVGALEDSDEKVRANAARAIAACSKRTLAGLDEKSIVTLKKLAANQDEGAAQARAALLKAGQLQEPAPPRPAAKKPAAKARGKKKPARAARKPVRPLKWQGPPPAAPEKK